MVSVRSAPSWLPPQIPVIRMFILFDSIPVTVSNRFILFTNGSEKFTWNTGSCEKVANERAETHKIPKNPRRKPEIKLRFFIAK